jgi:hypothetical protein
LALEGNKFHSSTSTIRFEGDVIMFASSSSALAQIAPFLSKATFISIPVISLSRKNSSTSRFSVELSADTSQLQAAASLVHSSGAKLVPTATLTNCSASDMDVLFRDASSQNFLMSDLVASLRKASADGVVLDFHSCLSREQSLLFKAQLQRVFAFLGSSILRKKMVSILIVPPLKGSAVVDAQVFAAADFETLEYSFTFFAVPFSAHVLPSAAADAGPRSPFAWIIKSIRAMLPAGSVKTKRAGKLLASIDLRAAVFDRRGGGWYLDCDNLAQQMLNHTGRCLWDSDAMEHSCKSCGT